MSIPVPSLLTWSQTDIESLEVPYPDVPLPGATVSEVRAFLEQLLRALDSERTEDEARTQVQKVFLDRTTSQRLQRGKFPWRFSCERVIDILKRSYIGTILPFLAGHFSSLVSPAPPMKPSSKRI